MRIDDEFLRLAASGKVPGASVRKACVCSDAVKRLCPHYQGGVLVLEGTDASLELVIGKPSTAEGLPVAWPLRRSEEGEGL